MSQFPENVALLLLYPWHRHEDICRYPWHIPRDIAAVISCGIFLCLPRAERNQLFLFVKNESIKFCWSGGFSNVPDVMEPSVLFISTVFHVRSVSRRCLYLGFRAPCAVRVTRVTCSKGSLLGVPLELE